MSTLCTYRTLAIASAIHLFLWLKLGQKNQNRRNAQGVVTAQDGVGESVP